MSRGRVDRGDGAQAEEIGREIGLRGTRGRRAPAEEGNVWGDETTEISCIGQAIDYIVVK